MKKIDRLKEIEKFWKSKPRNQQWEEIQWEPYAREGESMHFKSIDAICLQLKYVGYVFYTPSVDDYETMEYFDWEWALLDALNIWYSLPADLEVPIFINEKAEAVLLPHARIKDLAVLFQHPDSTLLGMDGWEERLAERNRENVPGRASMPDSATPVSAAQALAFLTK